RTEPETARLGARIRAYRQMRRMTVRGLAVEAQASPSFISRLARGRASASVRVLRRRATALGLTGAGLFSADDEAGPRVRRRRPRPPARPASRAAPRTRRYLTSQRPLQNVEVYAGEFEPGTSTGDEPYSHGESQETLLVLHGRVTVYLGPAGSASPQVLEPGDSVEYRTSVPHRVVNEGDEPAEAIWVISPPTPA